MSDPNVETLPVSPAGKAYIELLEKYGLLQGKPGLWEFRDQTPEVLHALHVVLAGGSVGPIETKGGVDSVIDDLDSRLAKAIEEYNAYPDMNVRF